MSEIRLLALGDVVGPEAVRYISGKLWGFRREKKIDIVVCNAENACAGNGLDPQSADRLLSGGCDVLTGGNHIFRKKEIRHYLDESEIVVRPANYPYGTPGNGYTIFGVNGFNILIINLLGTIYMESLACPFMTADRILEREKGRYDLAVLDFHAEATSEKIALGRYLDGRISAVWGTHTHVPTADERVMPKGTGYITDLGMTGPIESVIGIRPEQSVETFLGGLPGRYRAADGPCKAQGAIFTLESDTGLCTGVERVDIR